ncbi:MAG: DUF5103 domain-containing protein [Bacteroidales bacterium]|nr:DUF5103 domain-containing protein [Bacteroidales bacterium]
MPLIRQIFLFTVALFFTLNSLKAINTDTLPCVDRIYSKMIKTARIHQQDWEQSYPVMSIYGDNPLVFSFDQLEAQPIDFYYTIIHCTYDWQPSNLMFFEYAEGFEENEIKDYQDSYSTFVQYTHFSMQIPNRDLELKLSGNYLLILYSKEDGETILCTKRFMIYENLVDVSGRVNEAPESDYRKKFQKLDFRINRKSYNISNPHDDLKIVVMQNSQWDNAISNVVPSFIDNEFLVYEWDDKITFNSANEYRYFSFNNLEIYSEYVENIEFRKPYYYVKLYSAKPKFFDPYSSIEDINGHYVISTKRFANNDYPEAEAEYAIVEFSLDFPSPVSNGDVYIYGDLTGYQLTDEYKLQYDLEKRSYDKLLFLKQGYYNYRYVLVTEENSVIKSDHSYFEGSYRETENDYQLFIYHRDPSESYDKLINYTLFNSRN